MCTFSDISLSFQAASTRHAVDLLTCIVLPCRVGSPAGTQRILQDVLWNPRDLFRGMNQTATTIPTTSRQSHRWILPESVEQQSNRCGIPTPVFLNLCTLLKAWRSSGHCTNTLTIKADKHHYNLPESTLVSTFWPSAIQFQGVQESRPMASAGIGSKVTLPSSAFAVICFQPHKFQPLFLASLWNALDCLSVVEE